jgi:hypothetical protein
MKKVRVGLVLVVLMVAGCRSGGPGDAPQNGGNLVVAGLEKTDAKPQELLKGSFPLLFQMKVTVRNDSAKEAPLAMQGNWARDRTRILRAIDDRKRHLEVYEQEKRAGYPDVAEQNLRRWDKSVGGTALPLPWTLIIEIKTDKAQNWYVPLGAVGELHLEVAPGVKPNYLAVYDDCEAVMLPGNGTVSFTFWCRNEMNDRLTELRAVLIDPSGQSRSQAEFRRDGE